jgi:flagellar hook-basal body complex protein FliE
MASPIAAANAYASLARLTDPSGGLSKVVSEVSGTSNGGGNFSSVLKEALGAVAETARKSDTQAQALAAGKANVVDVVTAVAETEVAVEALVAVRDKMIQAYEEIMRMPI